jgi:hypothetical protein
MHRACRPCYTGQSSRLRWGVGRRTSLRNEIPHWLAHCCTETGRIHLSKVSRTTGVRRQGNDVLSLGVVLHAIPILPSKARTAFNFFCHTSPVSVSIGVNNKPKERLLKYGTFQVRRGRLCPGSTARIQGLAGIERPKTPRTHAFVLIDNYSRTRMYWSGLRACTEPCPGYGTSHLRKISSTP